MGDLEVEWDAEHADLGDDLEIVDKIGEGHIAMCKDAQVEDWRISREEFDVYEQLSKYNDGSEQKPEEIADEEKGRGKIACL